MIGQLPPKQLQDYLAQAMMMNEGEGGKLADDSFVGSVSESHVVCLINGEMAAVDQFIEMGFD